MDAELQAPALRRYLDSLVPERSGELKKMEAQAAREGFPIIGPASGPFCYLLTRLLCATRVFELGSGFGYSTAWFARGVKENGGGEVHHVVWDENLSRRARTHLGRLGLDPLIRYHVAEAVECLKAAPGPFDLIFCDIDKEGYPEALPVMKEKLRPGGVLIVDNMLWKGRIFSANDRTPATEGVRRMTRLLLEDPTWVTTLVPIRDGLLMAWKAG